MKNGKKKNPAAPFTAEVPQPIETKVKRNSAPIAASVANARKKIRRVEPAPQPNIASRRTRAKNRLRTVKKSASAAVEPIPQPRTVPKRSNRAAVPSEKVMTERAPNSPIKFAAAVPVKSPAPTEKTTLETSGVVTKFSTMEAPKPAAASAVVPNTPARPSAPGPTPVKARAARQPRPMPVEIPPILLEPDHVPTEPAIAGPGARFALTPPSEHHAAGQPDELPESYGTQRIYLAARDPYCLFASWDLDPKQRARYNTASASGALTIRLRRNYAEGPVFMEVHTLANSRDRFIEVAQPNSTFVAELGYHEKNTGLWRSISVSNSVTTPRDRVVPLPPLPPAPAIVEKPAPQPSEAHAPSVPVNPPVFEAPAPAQHEVVFAMQPPREAPRWSAKQEPESWRERLRWEPTKEKPRWVAPKPQPPPKWTPEKRKLLEELISLEFRRMQHGSLEIEELLRRRVFRESEIEESAAPSSAEWQELSPEELVAEALDLAQPAPSSLEVAAPELRAQKKFWFRVNAELIIYGSTEPDAHVSIGGRPIRLRPDGSFSYRFALPDGDYELPVIALSRDGDDGRAADLYFSRASIYSGGVGQYPQDPALKTPSPANL